MDNEDVQTFRRVRLGEAATKVGSKVALGRLLGYTDGAFVGQMLRGDRPITEKTVEELERRVGFRGWFGQAKFSGALTARIARLDERQLRQLEALITAHLDALEDASFQKTTGPQTPAGKSSSGENLPERRAMGDRRKQA